MSRDSEDYHEYLAELSRRLSADEEDVLADVLSLLGARTQHALRSRFHSVLNEADIEDVLSMALFKLWRERHRFDPARSRLDAWFYLLARNLAIDLLRRKSRSLEFNAMPLPAASLASQPGESSSIESAARRALKSDLQLALLKLSEDDQRILLSDKSSRELSSELGISEASVRVRRFRLLKRLKLMLQEMEHSSSRSSSADSTQRSINVHP